ncbi:DDE-type integrase/transposase/recombinase, partial [Leuconostoc mesenteroides]|nr:DDE-type integrase/transposase/recombinase [Leuconostoc mesenteroides]
PYVDAWLLRACAKLGVRLVHSTPGRPQGRGKIERFFRTVREQFLVEITGEPDVVGRHYVADLAELNRLFTAWVETVYHRSVHSETGQTPLARWSAGGPIPLPAHETLMNLVCRLLLEKKKKKKRCCSSCKSHTRTRRLWFRYTSRLHLSTPYSY